MNPNSLSFMKFEQKLPVWLVISERGISAQIIRKSGLAVKQTVYLDFIKRGVILLGLGHTENYYTIYSILEALHKSFALSIRILKGRLIYWLLYKYFFKIESICTFWPDLASSHYDNTVVNYLIDQNIKFVRKCENPANLPEVRPFEDFWFILKGKVYENGWREKNLDELRYKIRHCTRNLDQNLVQDLWPLHPNDSIIFEEMDLLNKDKSINKNHNKNAIFSQNFNKILREYGIWRF
ncbi:glucosylceramidase 4 [Brachionus plicatilis]|uniref:Glucosylceramidase 4 n=1 Tax=Brachionus plicatilis TaxID=10195 RepID=A0A3M7QTQ9_BRAPC|nr:glucosylceramidase 4 [Brachionus plicatilis]